MKLHPHAERIVRYHLGEPRRDDVISVADFNAAAGVVDRMVRDGLPDHADQHALAVRTNLGHPWSLRAKRLAFDEIQSMRWG